MSDDGAHLGLDSESGASRPPPRRLSPVKVIDVINRRSVAFLARNLETGEEAIIVTEPIHRDWNGRGPHKVIDTRGALRTRTVIDLRKRSKRSTAR